MNWREDLIKSSDLPTPYFVPIKEKDIQPLPIFVGGGGSISKFYCDAIARLTINEVIKITVSLWFDKDSQAKELDLGSLNSTEYHRFLIAFGLSIRFGESPDFTLPGEHQPIDKPIKKDIRLEVNKHGHNEN